MKSPFISKQLIVRFIMGFVNVDNFLKYFFNVDINVAFFL
jgi:hypothetical protein